jgi:hypothetical protein
MPRRLSQLTLERFNLLRCNFKFPLGKRSCFLNFVRRAIRFSRCCSNINRDLMKLVLLGRFDPPAKSLAQNPLSRFNFPPIR